MCETNSSWQRWPSACGGRRRLLANRIEGAHVRLELLEGLGQLAQRRKGLGALRKISVQDTESRCIGACERNEEDRLRGQQPLGFGEITGYIVARAGIGRHE